MHSIAHVYVDGPRRTEHGPVARRLPAVCVTSRIASRQIGLHFYEPPPADTGTPQYLANKRRGHDISRKREKGFRKDFTSRRHDHASDGTTPAIPGSTGAV
jgi:hypothetical protein